MKRNLMDNCRVVNSSMTTAILVVLAAGALSATALAQNYPVKPIRIVVGGVAGSPSDVRVRQAAQKLNESLGQPVVVDNRPGASGAIAAKLVAKSTPDGYTLFGCSPTNMLNDLFNPDPSSRLNYEIAPITRLTSGPLILAVHPSARASTLKEFIDLAKTKPGGLTYASGSQGSHNQLFGELIQAKAGIKLTGVSYKSGAAEIPDVLGGHINATVNFYVIVGPHITSGKLRALAVADARRLAVAPDLVTMAEAGLPGAEASGWTAICAPAGTPQPVINLLHRELVKALNDRVIRDQIISTGGNPGGERPDEFAAFIRAESAKWGKVIKDAGISIQ
jgi:tripartite-type tricarboxylate transporter receptor subunit TctC